MFQSNKLIICSLFLCLALHASADVEMKPEDQNRTGLYRPWSQEFLQFEPENLHGMTAEKLEKMSLSDGGFDLLRNNSELGPFDQAAS